MATAVQIQQSSKPLDHEAIQSQVWQHVDDNFADLDILTGQQAGPSSHSTSSTGFRRGKRRRNLQEDITYWENKARSAEEEVSRASIYV